MQFSGGIGSWAAAQRVVDEHGTDDVVLLFADTQVEDEDLYRFLDDAAAQLGVPVTVVADGRTPFEVFRDQRFLVLSPTDICRDCPSRVWVISAESGAFADLLEHLERVSDWRHGQWVDHPLAAVLALCAGAVVAGVRGFTAIVGCVRDVPPDVLASIYVRSGRVGVTRAAARATLWRIVTGVPCDVLDAVIGSWLLTRASAVRSLASHEAGSGDLEAESGELVAIAADGKTVQGAVGPDGAQVHLLAAMTHVTGLVVGQVRIIHPAGLTFPARITSFQN